MPADPLFTSRRSIWVSVLAGLVIAALFILFGIEQYGLAYYAILGLLALIVIVFAYNRDRRRSGDTDA